MPNDSAPVTDRRRCAVECGVGRLKEWPGGSTRSENLHVNFPDTVQPGIIDRVLQMMGSSDRAELRSGLR